MEKVREYCETEQLPYKHFKTFIKLPLISDEEMTEILDNVKKSNVDLIVFLGTNHTRLIKILDRETALFRLPLVTIMVNGASVNVNLRLDTNIVSFEQSGGPDKYLLTETYSIKNGPKLSQVIGTWSRSNGLAVSILNVYERRQNLGGIQLRDAILPYAKITKPHFDSNYKVTGSGGVFQG